MTRRRWTEDCLQLRVSHLREILASGMKAGTCSWSTEQGHSCSWYLSSKDGMQILALSHETEHHGRQSYGIEYVWKQTALGTRRLYFRCPNVHCQRTITTLYWPLGGQYFLCRHCWRLEYRSQHEKSLGPTSLELLAEWEQQDMTTRKGRRRAGELWQQYEAVLKEIEPSAARMRVTSVLRRAREKHPELWQRRPGRPSLKKWRAAARAARAADRAAERAARPKLPPGRPKEKREYIRRQPWVLSERSSDMDAFCPKCRDRRELVAGKRVTFRNGRPAMQGTCRQCGTKMARIVKGDSRKPVQRKRGTRTNISGGSSSDAWEAHFEKQRLELIQLSRDNEELAAIATRGQEELAALLGSMEQPDLDELLGALPGLETEKENR